MIRRSLFLAFAEKSVGTLLSVTMMIVISRLLTPAEVGLFLVSSAAVILIETFRDFGMAACIIQEKELTRGFLRTAFTLVTALSALLGVGLYLFSSEAAAFYGAPDLAPLLEVASLGFIFAPISSVRLALLKREMAFGKVAAIGIGANATGAVTSIVLAVLGAGAMSLAWGPVVGAGAAALIAFVLRPETGSFRPSLEASRRILAFGGWSSMVTLLGLLFETFPRLILGRVLGFTAVSLFSRGLSLTQLPEKLLLSAVQPVILPAFASALRSGQALGPAYLKALTFIATVQWPALLCLAILADPIVRVLLGQQWLEVIPLLRVIAIAGIPLFPAALTFPVLVATGRISEMALLNLVLVPVSMGIIAVATQFGLPAVAWSLLPINLIQGLALVLAVRRHVPFAWSGFGRSMGQCLVPALAAALAPGAMVLASGPEMGIVEFALAFVGAALGWGAALILTGNPVAEEIGRPFRGRLGRFARPVVGGQARP